MSDSGHRTIYAACYIGMEGNLFPIGNETAIREHAQAAVNQCQAEDDSNTYVLGERPLYPWTEVSSDE